MQHCKSPTKLNYTFHYMDIYNTNLCLLSQVSYTVMYALKFKKLHLVFHISANWYKAILTVKALHYAFQSSRRADCLYPTGRDTRPHSKARLTDGKRNIPQLSIVWNGENYISADEINHRHMNGVVRAINSHICQSYGMKCMRQWQNLWLMIMTTFHAFSYIKRCKYWKHYRWTDDILNCSAFFWVCGM